METYDVVVLGSGVAGATIASACRSKNLKVAIIDYGPLGGTCPIRGCDPKKILWGASEPIGVTDKLDFYDNKLKLNWNKLIKFKKTFTDPVPKKREESFKNAGIAIFKGRASFTGKNTVKVGSNELKGKYIAIATGAKPMPLNMEGDNLVTTSDEFMETENLPEEIIFIGGGYISFEFAHIAARAGSKVKIIHIDDRPLVNFDPDIVDKLLDATRDAGIEFIPNSPAKAFRKEGNKIIVKTENGELKCDMAVHGAGRIPEIDKLNLEKAEIEYDKGIKVNEFMQSVSNRSVYAAGDCVAKNPPLTPVATVEAKTVAQNILRGNSTRLQYPIVPSVVFTIPTLASVGLTEKEAEEKNINYKVNFLDLSKWYNSRRLGFKHTALKILVNKSNGTIIGAHLFYPQSEDIVNLFSLAIQNGIPLEKIKNTIFTYPSNTSDIRYMI